MKMAVKWPSNIKYGRSLCSYGRSLTSHKNFKEVPYLDAWGQCGRQSIIYKDKLHFSQKQCTETKQRICLEFHSTNSKNLYKSLHLGYSKDSVFGYRYETLNPDLTNMLSSTRDSNFSEYNLHPQHKVPT